MPIFGHFMMECLNRLWFVVQNPELKSKILFIITGRGNHCSYFDDFFRLMGIASERIIYVDKPIQCRSVTVPDQAQYWDSYNKEWQLPYLAMKSQLTPGNLKKLYLTRTKLEAAGHCTKIHCNEKYFEDFFTARGFEAIAMEELKLEEQISLIMGADEIAAIMGTLTHWALFCKPSAKFIMFPRTNHDETPFQRVVNNIFGNYYIVDIAKNFMYAAQSKNVGLIGSTKYWKEFVADYFGEHIEIDDDNLYFEQELERYIDLWAKKYNHPSLLNIWIDSLNDMSKRIAALEKETGMNQNADALFSDTLIQKQLEAKDLAALTNTLKDLCNRILLLEKVLNENRPVLTYQTHVAWKGWGAWKNENRLSNPPDQMADIQAIKINFPSHKVYYSVYYSEQEVWSEEVSNTQMAGTTGKKKPIMGIKIRLDEAGSKEFDILYRVHKFDGEWTTWAKNGEEIYSHGQKLNSIQIRLKPKSEPSPSLK